MIGCLVLAFALCQAGYVAQPAYYPPQQAYYQPAPQQYYQPQPVYYAPQPVYYAPQPVYAAFPVALNFNVGGRGGYYGGGHRRCC
jgi:hypothetical protein